MYDIRQFRPVLYGLLLLGMTGFAVAAGGVGWWLLGAGGVVVHAVLVKRGAFRPIPRWAANLLTLAVALPFGLQLLREPYPVLIVAKFLVVLQLVKLFERRAARDEAQLLVLSLLLMVASAISTDSLVFGLMFIAYLFLALYCCLLFHLKVETDVAKRAMGLKDHRDEGFHPLTLRQDQRHFPRSMRRLTAFVSVVAVLTGVVVFLAFPRGAGAGFLGPMQPFRPEQALTGLSEEVSFQDVARIQQNDTKAGYMSLFDPDDERVTDGRTVYLRGNVLDTYDADPDSPGAWQWRRTVDAGGQNQRPPRIIPAGVKQNFWPRDLRYWRQDITLEPTGTRTLLGMRGIGMIRPTAQIAVRHTGGDGVLKLTDPLRQRLSYEVWSVDALPSGIGTPRPIDFADRVGRRIRELTLRPEVSGEVPAPDGSRTSLAAARRAAGPVAVTRFDSAIAANIERYLQTEFTYTLDLTREAELLGGTDPIEQFLFEWQKGHCEYFAGAMALMCQSVGLDARVVVGFKTDEFNPTTGSYILRQSQAHAWVEVRTEKGWRRYDPTSGREAPEPVAASAWEQFKNLIDFFEYQWAENVVAYDGTTRDNLYQQVEYQLQNTAINTTANIGDANRWLSDRRLTTAESVLTVVITVMIVAVIGFVGYFAFERWRLRRRARRIGLADLPPGRRRRLARQLAFYDELIQLLESHGLKRRRHQTPREFAESLTTLPTAAYDTVRRLTAIHYDVRYGDGHLTPRRQRKLRVTLEELQRQLAPTT
jgi:transglutaminase-like putative cysteine protease